MLSLSHNQIIDATNCYKLMNNLIDIDCTDFYHIYIYHIFPHAKGNSRKLLKHNIVNIRDANTFHNRVML